MTAHPAAGGPPWLFFTVDTPSRYAAGARSMGSLAARQAASRRPGTQRLLDRLRGALCTRSYSRRTEEAYAAWARRYIVFHGKRCPSEMVAPKITASPLIRHRGKERCHERADATPEQKAPMARHHVVDKKPAPHRRRLCVRRRPTTCAYVDVARVFLFVLAFLASGAAAQPASVVIESGAAKCAAAPAIRVDEVGTMVALTTSYKSGEARLRGPKPGTPAPTNAAIVFDILRVPASDPIDDKLPYLCNMLVRYAELNAGRLPSRFVMKFYPEMKPRLAEAAAQSPEWDRKAGRAHSGLANPIAAKLMNDHKVYAELDKLFADLGLRISVNSVEKADTFVLSVADMEKRGIRVTTPGLSRKDRLPTQVLINYYQLEGR